MDAVVDACERPGQPAAAPLRPLVAWAVLVSVLTLAVAARLRSSGADYRDFSPAILVVAYAPALAAIAITCFQRGTGGVRALLTQLVRWRAPLWCYALALAGPLAFACATVAVFPVLGGIQPATPLVLPSDVALLATLGPVLSGSLGEELGWRGFAQARLQTRHGPLRAAVVVGILWSIWHLWPALTPDGSAELSTENIAQTFLRLVATAIVYAWLYNVSAGSLPVVLVAHAAHNLAVDLMPPDVIGTSAGALTMSSLYVLAAAAVLVATRGRLTGKKQQPVGALHRGRTP